MYKSRSTRCRCSKSRIVAVLFLLSTGGLYCSVDAFHQSQTIRKSAVLVKYHSRSLSWSLFAKPSEVTRPWPRSKRNESSITLDSTLPRHDRDIAITKAKGKVLDNLSSVTAYFDVNHENDDARSLTQLKCIMLSLLWGTAFISALDRVAMSVAMVRMSEEFGYSDTVKGAISSLFSVGYGMGIIPAGLLVGSLSAKRVMMAGIAVWSLATLMTPYTASIMIGLSPLLMTRAWVGVGESFFMPTLQRLLTVWTNPEEKSRGLAFVLSGFQAGTIAAYLVSPYIMDAWNGWRDLFIVYGGAGVLILVPWCVFARDHRHPVDASISSHSDDVSSKSPLHSSSSSISSSSSLPSATFLDNGDHDPVNSAWSAICEAPWKSMLQSKAVWGMLIAHCAKNWGQYNSLAWMPTFYVEQYGMSVSESAFLSLLPSLAGAVGGFLAGVSTDALVQRVQARTDFVPILTRIRHSFQTVGMVGPAVALGLLAWDIPSQPWFAQCFLAAALGLQSFNAGGFEVAIQDKAGPRWSGLLYSVTTLPAVLVGTGGVFITGVLLDGTQQNWSLVFAINAFIYLCGAVAFISWYDARKEFD